MHISFDLDSRALAHAYDRVGDPQYQHGKRLIDSLELRPGERVLDVGCGTGRLAAHVATLIGPTGRVDAIDPLPLRVELAHNKGVPNLFAQVGSAEDLSSFPDHHFDAVFLNSVYHWLPEKLRPLREAFRVLRPGGRIAISTATLDRVHDFELAARRALEASRIGANSNGSVSSLHKVSSHELRVQLAAAGFEGVELVQHTFVDYFDSAEDVLTFNLASSFGNFLSRFSADEKLIFRALMRRELETLRTKEGIRLERHLIFARATSGPKSNIASIAGSRPTRSIHEQ